MTPATVACVLRSGGDFDASWVRALHRGVREYASAGVDFVCLTDLPLEILGVETVPLLHNWPGWWSKVELWRRDIFAGPVLYMDLDTLPVGPLDDLLSYSGDLAVLSDFYQPLNMASGVLAWSPSPESERPYLEMVKRPATIMRQNPTRSDYWYRKVIGPVDRLQTLYPGQIVSLKAHAKDGPPRGARLVCGHGKPRFSSAHAGWAHRLWKGRAR